MKWKMCEFVIAMPFRREVLGPGKYRVKCGAAKRTKA